MSKRARYGIACLVVSTAIVLGVLAIRQRLGARTPVPPLTHDQIAGPAVIEVNADELQATMVTAHLDCAIDGNSNVLWCATFQIAWNALCDLEGGAIPNVSGLATVDLLNQRTVTANDLDEASYVALAGYATGGSDDVLDRIEASLQEKFHGAACPTLLPDRQSLGSDDAVAYAYLFKSLPFAWAFTPNQDRGIFFADRNVQSFGIIQLLPEQKDEVKMARQVRVYDYQDRNDFIVELKTRSELDRLILAKVAPGATLEQTVRTVQKRLKAARPKPMVPLSSLQVPILDFDITKDYEALLDGGWTAQQIRFKLDETGAVLWSQATVVRSRSQTLIFDQPFLVMLQRVGATNPYFALWVANTELLIPVEEVS